MLAKKFRLVKKDFAYIYKKGKRKSNGFFLIIYTINQSNFSRFAVVINKKTAKLATQRNKTRRQIFRLINNNTDKIPKGLNFVIHSYKNFDNSNIKIFSQKFLEIITYHENNTVKNH